MHSKIRMFFAAFTFVFCFQLTVNASDTDGDIAVRLYVARRPLGAGELWKPLTNLNKFAHSAVLLETRDNKFFLLEYQNDSKVHLNLVTPETISTHEDGSFMIIEMNGASDKDASLQSFRWTRQLKGVSLTEPMSVKKLRDRMATTMATSQYSIPAGHHCHKAQESLRRSLNLTVD